MSDTPERNLERGKVTPRRGWFERWRRDADARIVLIFLLVGIFVAVAEVTRLPGLSSLLESLEFKIQDQFFAWRAEYCPQRAFQTDAFQKIVIVKLDDESLRRLGLTRRGDCSARMYMKLLSVLNEAGAHVVGLDVAEMRHREGESTESSVQKPAVRTTVDTHNLVTTPSSTLDIIGNESYESIGYSALMPDDDGVVRHAQLSMSTDPSSQSTDLSKSFALRIVEKYFGANSAPNERGGIFLKEHYFPQRFRLNYAGAPGSFPMVSLWRALDWRKHYERNGLFVNQPSTSHDASRSPFKDKVVLVGAISDEGSATTTDAADPDRCYVTPLSGDAALMSNVELQANVISNVLDHQYFLEPLGWEYLVIVAVVSIIAGRILSLCRKRPGWYLAILTGLATLWMVASFYAFAFLHLLIPSVVSILAVTVPASLLVLFDQKYLLRFERSRRLRLFRSLAAKPMAQEIERSLLAELGLEGKHLTVTVVACQLRDFSTDVSDKPAEETLNHLNACLKTIMQSIGESNGIVERVWNCGVIGLWGAPIAKSADFQADSAIRFINDVQTKLALKAQEFAAENRAVQPFGFSAGICTGTAICGTINATAGDSVVMQYGAFGPAMDIAVELERLNLQYGTTCMLSSSTASYVKDKALVRELDSRALGSAKSEQSIFEFLAKGGSLPAVYDEAMALFREAQQTFEAGRVAEAKKLFGAVAELVPNDRPTAIMLQKCSELIDFAPKGD